MRRLLVVPLVLLAGCAVNPGPGESCVQALEAADAVILSHLDAEGALVDALSTVPDALTGGVSDVTRLIGKISDASDSVRAISHDGYLALRDACLTQ